MEDIRFSVIIPTCDRPEYVREAVDSVLAQTYLPHQIIVIDNGRLPLEQDSLPSSSVLGVVRALPRFGVSQARNLGSVLATGTHLAFLDDDDRWDTGYLEAVADTLEDRPDASVVLGRLRRLSDQEPIEGKQAEFSDEADLVKKLLARNPGTGGSNTTVAKDAFAMSPGYDPWLITNEDKALVLEMLLRGGKVVRANDAWVEFRDDQSGERLTDDRNRAVGKWRFTCKYWALMPWKVRFFNLMWVIVLRLR